MAAAAARAAQMHGAGEDRVAAVYSIVTHMCASVLKGLGIVALEWHVK